MKVQLEHILQNLFSKPSLDDVQLYELQEMVKDHPYFSTGHFLLAQKLKLQHTDEYEAQAQKTALYFHDPLWMQWQLKQMSNGAAIEIPAETNGREALEPEEELAVTTVGPVEEGIPATPAEVEENMPDEIETPPAPETVEETIPAEETAKEEDHAPVAPPSNEFVHSASNNAPIAFDAYYTIDYFASQGIKAPAEVQPDDKLGKQLKSFTEWLKTMKRLPQSQQPAQIVNDEAEQQTIRRFAAGSLEEKEVVTETMAEVLQKQGRNQEAIAIYEKLSLSDPSKSAYFAAKIENLKEN
jgi:hypothetical protein